MATLAELKAAADLKRAQVAQKDAEAKLAEVTAPITTGARMLKEAEVVAKKDQSIRYFCKIPGHRFIFEDGTEGFFNYGRLDIGPEIDSNWRQHQRELNAILGRQTTIFVPEVPPEVAPVVAQNAKSEKEIQEQENKLLSGQNPNVRVSQEVGQVAVDAGLPTDVNQSSIDPALQAAMMGTMGAAPSISG